MFIRISVSDLANAGPFGQDVVERRQFYPSNELYNKNGELRSLIGKLPRINQEVRHVKRVLKYERPSRGHGTTLKGENNLAAKTSIDRQYILVLVSNISMLFYFSRVPILRSVSF